jgi:hypothetical protein
MIGDIVRWFEGEVKSLPVTFARPNKNFACFAIADIFKMLQESSCEHLPELHPLAASNNASLLDGMPMEVQKIIGRLVAGGGRNMACPKLCIICERNPKW